jgi:subtilisin family serine protease
MTFLILNFSQATELLIYSSSISLRLQEYGFITESVFTKNEKKLLEGSNVNTNIIKVKTNNIDKLKRIVSKICKECKTQINHIGTSLSTSDTYSKFQWSLDNKGNELETWISDIDSYMTQGQKNEDINIDHNETNKKVTVAIIDSGIDINHPDLKANIYTNEKECKALEEYNKCLFTTNKKEICYDKYAQVDYNNNGYPLDCHGWNISGKSNPKNDIEGNGNITDNIGHGTHVAGIIGAQKNDIGITGIISNVVLLPIQVSVASQNNTNGELATDKFAKALLYAIKSKAHIINMSLGWRFEQDSILMREMIEFAHKSNIIIIAAGGNDHHAGPTYPCSYEEVICVGSHSVDGKLSSFSNFGSHIDILAPGNKILSTWPTTKRSKSFTIDDDYEYMSGTSQATPIVSAVVARLLNQGMTADEAKIKLLKGARASRSVTNNYIRHGNVDYLKSLEIASKSFIYPLNKSAALINWNKEIKSFKVKIKNYGQISNNIKISIEHLSKASQKEIKIVKKTFSSTKLAINELLELKVEFTSNENVDGNFLFNIKIESDEENKAYFFQAKALSVITPETRRDDLETKKIIGNTDFLKNANLRPFKNINVNLTTDFLAFKEINGITFVARVLEKEDCYEVSKEIKLPFKNPVMINLSKVDLDLDEKSDYVITAVNFISRENRDTKFLAFDEKFKLKRILISPKNTFENKLTVMPGSFLWLKYNSKMVPAWIGMGERPISDREQATPWSTAPIELKQNRLYIQLPSGLKTILFPEDEELPLHFLYQSNESKQLGNAVIVSSSGFGYFKSYKAYKFDNGIKFIQDIYLDRFFDLASSKPLPIVNSSASDNAFFATQSIKGNQNVLALKYNKAGNYIETNQVRALSKKPNNSIRFVLSYDDSNLISQTNNELILQSSTTSTTPSKTDARRIKHQILNTTQALFLPSSLTPGLGSELIRPWIDGNNMYRPSMYQTLGAKGCSEVKMILENDIDKLVYLCSSTNKILKVNISKM